MKQYSVTILRRETIIADGESLQDVAEQMKELCGDPTDPNTVVRVLSIYPANVLEPQTS